MATLHMIVIIFVVVTHIVGTLAGISLMQLQGNKPRKWMAIANPLCLAGYVALSYHWLAAGIVISILSIIGLLGTDAVINAVKAMNAAKA